MNNDTDKKQSLHAIVWINTKTGEGHLEFDIEGKPNPVIFSSSEKEKINSIKDLIVTTTGASDYYIIELTQATIDALILSFNEGKKNG